MSEKQPKERSLFKQFLRLFFRSSFRRPRSSFEQGRASSFVAESEISDQELQRVVHNDSIEDLVNHYVTRRFQSYLINKVEDYALWESICYDFENFDLEIWNKLSQDNWNLIKRVCYTQEFWLNHADQKDTRTAIMFKTFKNLYYEKWTLNQIRWVKRFYRKLSSVIQNRKNELLEILSLSIQSFSIQSLSSSQASWSFSSSITIISATSSTQNRISYKSRTQYESDTRQNRYTDIQNRQSDSESRHENRQFNLESREDDRLFNSESRYDRESNRFRNRQYEFSEYAFTKYADENLRSMNEIRRASQSDH